MSSNNNSAVSVLTRNSIINLLGMVTPFIFGVFLVPPAIKGLGKESFGILSISWVVLGYMGLLDFGIGRGVTKFIAQHRNDEKPDDLHSIMQTGLLLTVILGIVFGTALILAKDILIGHTFKVSPDMTAATQRVFVYLGIAMPFVFMTSCLRGIFAAFQRFDLINIVIVPANSMMLGIPALSLPFQIDLTIVVLLIVSVKVITSLVFIVQIRKLSPQAFTRNMVSRGTLQSLMKYGGWISVSNFIGPLMVYIDRFFIGSMVSMSSVTFYTAPGDALTRLRVFPISLMTTLFPEFSAAAASGDVPAIGKMAVLSTKYIFLFMSVLCAALALLAPDILRIWLGPEFVQSSLVVFRLFCVGLVVNSVAYVAMNLLQGVGAPDIPAKFHLLEFPVYLVILYFLIKQFGLNGAAAAWVLRIILDAGLLVSAAAGRLPEMKCLAGEYKVARTAVIIGCYCTVLLLTGFLSGQLIVNAVLSVIFTALLFPVCWTLVMTRPEQDLLLSAVRKTARFAFKN